MTDEPEWRHALADHALPAAVVDLDALAQNVDRLVAAVPDGPVTMRVATKSVRHPGLLRRILARGGDRMRGLMAYAPGELALLADAGFDDLLLAYPIGRPFDARLVADTVARGIRCRVVVDAADQVARLATVARERGLVLELCLDVDLSWRPVPVVHLGVRRSPIRSAAEALALARLVRDTPGVSLVGVMAYEAQIAGMRGTDPIRRFVQQRSRPMVLARRQQIVEALARDGFALSLVNGGGTGSVAFTGADPSVTEVAAGSGFLCPHLFDGYGLAPAAFFALPVVRSSDPGFVTCAGGGYPASGAAGADRLPIVVAPPGLVPLALEGWGEVQTPFRWTGSGAAPAPGDVVVARHAKAGELFERFATCLLVQGGRIVAEEPTYRGMGACFP